MKQQTSDIFNWTNYCATNDNRRQCSKEKCTQYPICKIKVPISSFAEKLKKGKKGEVKNWVSIKEIDDLLKEEGVK